MSEAAIDPPNLPKALVADRLADFPDRLSPMLVKELRQGLRARTFVIVFLALQALLGLVLLASLGAARSPQAAGHQISGIIFMFLSMALLVIQPVRGIGSLHREVREHTIELLVLTNLSAWKIVLGKWISIVSQSALLLAAVVPYLILRYWFGNMNLFGELVLLGLVFVLSASATAVVVGLSCLPSMIIRGLLPLVAAAIGIVVIPEFCFGHDFRELVEICTMQDSETFWSITTFVLAAAYVGWTALGLGASLIAPAAENHSSSKRLVALALMVLALGIAAIVRPGVYPLIAISLVIGVPSMIMALNEPSALLPPICAPFIRKGLAGRLAGRFLYPGWPSGAFFSLVMVGLAALMVAKCGNRNLASDEATVLTGILSSLLMPAALMSFFDKRIGNRFTLYLLVLVSQFVLTLVLAYITDAVDRDRREFLWLFSWIPMVTLTMNEIPTSFDPGRLRLVTTVIAWAYGAVILINSAIRIRSVREVESECLNHSREGA